MNSSNSMRPVVVGGVGIFLGLIIGLAVGQRRNVQPSPPVAEQASGKIEHHIEGKISSSRSEGNTPALPAESSESALEELRAVLSQNRLTDLAACALIIKKLRLHHCQQAMELLFQIPNSDTQSLISMIARRWASLDPEGALEASNKVVESYSYALTKAAITELIARKGEKALAYLEGTSGRRKQHLAQSLLPQLAAIAPDAVLSFMEQNSDLKRNGSLMEQIVLAIASESPERGFEIANALPNERDRKNLTVQIWTQWIQRDPAEVALAIPGSNLEDDEKGRVYEALIKYWSQRDAHSALAWLEAQPDEGYRLKALANFVVRLPNVTSDVVERLMKLSDMPKMKEALAQAHVTQLAKRDVQSALQWAATLQDESIQKRVKARAYEEWLRENPAEAVQHFLTLKGESDQNVLIQKAVNEWTHNDPEKALKWLQELPPGETRDHGLIAAVRSARDEDTSTALAFLNQIQDPKNRDQATLEVLERYGAENGPAAAALAQTISAEKQPEAYYSLIRSWGMKDKTEAGNWIKTLPPGNGRDSAIKAYVSVIDGYDAGMAVRWASTIQDPTERPEAMLDAFQRWVREDSAAAERWLGEGTVDPAFKPFFEKELKGTRKAGD